MEPITELNPIISVIMPVYNSLRYLKDAVESILQQSFKNFEFLIFDDGSTDGSREKLMLYAAADSRIRLFLRDHGGHTRLLNEGINYSQGEFIARMDSDDIAMPSRFETQIDYLGKHPDCVAVGSEVLIIDPDGSPIGIKGQDTEHEAIDQTHLNGRGGAVIHPSAMFRKDALQQIGGYKPELEPAEDFDLFLRLAEVGKLANVPQVLMKYRQHFQRTTDRRRDTQLKKIREIVTHTYLNRGLGSPSEHLFEKPKIITPIERREQWARTAMAQGYYTTSYKHSFVVLTRKFHSLETWKLVLKSSVKLSLSSLRKLKTKFYFKSSQT